MPTYEYQCEGCKKQIEIEQRITEPAIKKCPKCGKLKLKRLVGSGNFILKGGGWYADLYSSPPPSGSRSSDSGDGDSSSKPAATKSDAKSDTKSDAKPKADAKPKKSPASKPSKVSSKGK